MENRAFNDRIEKKYQIGIGPSDVAGLWRDLRSFLAPYGLAPAQEITSVGSVYFDNKDFDLLRYSLFGRLMLVRVRAYEMYGTPPEPIGEYWVEVKTAANERRKKRRFQVTKNALFEFLENGDPGATVFKYNRHNNERHALRDLYRETQETILTMGLRPVLLVVYKRVAFQSEVERLSIDWDVQYHYANMNIFEQDSWKYLEKPEGKTDRVILEMKYLEGGVPTWFHELQRRYPVWEKEYLKPVEGMGFLFQGPLGHHREANSFLEMIEAYTSQPLR